MELLGQIGAFIEGLKSVVDVSGTVRSTLSEGIAGGISGGTARAMPMIARTLAGIGVFVMGAFFVAWGAAMLLDRFAFPQYPGAGYALVGIGVAVTGLAYLKLGAKA
ncbi:MAG: hypothetical protein PHF51_03175 [Candidatus ainarchaeum sp.]|nr:hypothetical protein [Candidatus ainarchaeum sp.]